MFKQKNIPITTLNLHVLNWAFYYIFVYLFIMIYFLFYKHFYPELFKSKRKTEKKLVFFYHNSLGFKTMKLTNEANICICVGRRKEINIWAKAIFFSKLTCKFISCNF